MGDIKVIDDLKTIEDLKIILDMCSIPYRNDTGDTTLAKRSIDVECIKMTNNEMKWLKDILDKNHFQYINYRKNYLYINKIREYL